MQQVDKGQYLCTHVMNEDDQSKFRSKGKVEILETFKAQELLILDGLETSYVFSDVLVRLWKPILSSQTCT